MSSPDQARLNVAGVSPVLEVPFLPDERLDVDGFGRVVDHVLGTGVTSVMFPGFASEVHKLSDLERTELCDALLDRTRPRPNVSAIVSIPDHSTHLAIQRAVDVVEAGADVLNILPPHQLNPGPAQVRQHLAEVLTAVAPTPVILQYAPAQTGTTLDAYTINALAEEHSNLAFVKVESSPPGRLVQALAALPASLPCLVGYAGLQLPDALRRGAIGVQPGCSFTELYVDLWARWASGDHAGALALHSRLLPYLSYWMQGVELIVSAEKLISYRRGLTDTSVTRSPRYVLDSEEIAMVEAFLTDFADLLSPVPA